jgi:hypothetical protein
MFLFLLALILGDRSYAGDRYMLYIGGGGETVGKSSTIFDDSLQAVGGFLSSGSWHSDVSFDGGHPTTDGILKDDFKNSSSVSSFTQKSYNDLIDKYKKEIEGDTIHSGDELMVLIDSHGAQNNGEKTHSIGVGAASPVTDRDTLEGTDKVNLDSLQELKALAEAKHIKLAIVDLSCHSGNTQALADDSTCVVSATGPMQYAYSQFSQNFTNGMKSGRSLEDVFLDARKEEDYASFPMISSPAGKELDDRLYSVISPYLYYRSKAKDNGDKLTSYLFYAAEQSCSPDQDPASVIAQIQQLKSVVNDSAIDTSTLLNLLTQYKRVQDQIAGALHSWNAPLLRTKETCVSSDKQSNGYRLDYTWAELLQTNLEENITSLSDQLGKGTDPKDKAYYQAAVECMKDFAKKRQAIEEKHPDLAGYADKFNTLINNAGDTESMAFRIAVEYRKIYVRLYGDLAKTEKGPNACKDFTF